MRFISKELLYLTAFTDNSHFLKCECISYGVIIFNAQHLACVIGQSSSPIHPQNSAFLFCTLRYSYYNYFCKFFALWRFHCCMEHRIRNFQHCPQKETMSV
ncbi:unnamed protein product, partial [Cylicocyclus nassatus]